jgi:hypothetical protein
VSISLVVIELHSKIKMAQHSNMKNKNKTSEPLLAMTNLIIRKGSRDQYVKSLQNNVIEWGRL